VAVGVAEAEVVAAVEVVGVGAVAEVEAEEPR